MRTAISDALTHLIINWKSTVQGVLSVVIALGVYFTAVPSNVLSQHVVGIITLITGAAKVLLALSQKDTK